MGRHGRIDGLVRRGEVEHLQLTVVRLEFAILDDGIDERGINRILDGHFVAEAVDCSNRAQFQDVCAIELFRIGVAFHSIVMCTANDRDEVADIVVERAALCHTNLLGLACLEFGGRHVDVVGNHAAAVPETGATERGKDRIAHPASIVDVGFVNSTGRNRQSHVVIVTRPAGRQVANGKGPELGRILHVFAEPCGIIRIELGSGNVSITVENFGIQEGAVMDCRGNSRGTTVFPFECHNVVGAHADNRGIELDRGFRVGNLGERVFARSEGRVIFVRDTDCNVVCTLVLHHEHPAVLDVGKSLDPVGVHAERGEELCAATGNRSLHGQVVGVIFGNCALGREHQDRSRLVTHHASIVGSFVSRSDVNILSVDTGNDELAESLGVAVGRTVHKVAHDEARIDCQCNTERIRVAIHQVIGLPHDVIGGHCTASGARVSTHDREEDRVAIATGLVTVLEAFVGKHLEVHVGTGCDRLGNVVDLTGHAVTGSTIGLVAGSGKVFDIDRILLTFFPLGSLAVEGHDKAVGLQVALAGVTHVDFFAIGTDILDMSAGIEHGAGSIQALVILPVVETDTESPVHRGGIGQLGDLVQLALGGEADNSANRVRILEHGVLRTVFEFYTNSRCPHFCSHGKPHGCYFSA